MTQCPRRIRTGCRAENGLNVAETTEQVMLVGLQLSVDVYDGRTAIST